MRHRSVSIVCLAAGACASTAAAPPPATPERSAPPPQVSTAEPPAEVKLGLARDVGGAEGLARLCEALRDEDAMTFDGNEVQRARAREEHRRKRDEAIDGRYLVQVPASGFSFRGYDLGDRRLQVDTARGFVLADGVEVQLVDPQAPMAFELAPDAADALLKAHAAGRTALRLVVRPARSDLRHDTCLRQSGGRIVKLPGELLAFSVTGPDGAVVGRGQTPEFADQAAAVTPVAAPEVTVGKPRAADGREVSESVASAARGLAPVLLACYEKSLQGRHTVRGTLVLDVRVGGDGRLESPRMEMSSVGDEALVSCVLGRVAKARLSGIAGPIRLSIPVAFGSRDER